MDDIRAKISKAKVKPDEFYVYVATDFSDWQKAALATLSAVYSENGNSFPEDTAKVIIARKEPWMTKDVMQDALAFIAFVRANAVKYGPEALSATPAINDGETLQSVLSSVATVLQVPTIHVLSKEDDRVQAHGATRSKARPGEPTVTAPPAKK
jgi:hypothetical protein